MAYGLTLGVWGPSNSLIQETFHIDKVGVGLCHTILFIGFTISVILGGWLLDRLGAKFLSALGPGLLGGGLILFASTDNYAVALATMFILGCGAGLLEAAVNTLVSEWGGERRAFAMNLLHMQLGIGAFAAMRGAGILLSRGISWQSLHVGIGVFGLLVAAVFLIQKSPERAGTNSLRAGEATRFFARPLMIVLSVGIFCYVGAEIGINDWIVLYFERNMGIAKQTASAVSANFWLFMTVGRLFCTIAARYVRAEILLLVLSALSSVAAVLVFFCPGVGSAGVFLSLSGFFSSGIFATVLAIGGNRYPRNVGIVSGILIGCSGVGNVFFPVAIGAVAQAFNLRLAMTLSCGMLFFLVICAIAAMRSGRDADAADIRELSTGLN